VLGCAPATTAPIAATPTAAPAASNRPRFLLKHDAEVMVNEPAPHQGVGQTTAYRYFDELKDAGVIFRKRALHPGAANGLNVLKHDEVFYVLSGRGELDVDGTLLALEPGTAVFLSLGAGIRLRQTGSEDLVVIIAYPPSTSH
jgi:mannose-6-phosphate isomerase-like protein (cupin superfamily)